MEENANHIEIGYLKSAQDRLEAAIYKLGEQNTHLAELNADSKTLIHIQEQRLSMMEKDYTAHKESMASMRQEMTTGHKELHSRITTAERDAEVKVGKLLDKISDQVGELGDGVEQKFANFDRLKWTIVGGAMMIGLLFGYADGMKVIFSAFSTKV